jgi:hypothetical protein
MWLSSRARLSAIRPGISCSASRISLRPNSGERQILELERLAGRRPFAASNGCIFSVTVAIQFSFSRRAFVSSWLHLSSSAVARNNPGPFAFVSDASGTTRIDSNTVDCSSMRTLRSGKPEPDVSPSADDIVAVVRQHVGDDEASPGLRTRATIRERALRLGDVVSTSINVAASSRSSSMGRASISPRRRSTLSNGPVVSWRLQHGGEASTGTTWETNGASAALV